jgi:hypothetical protein
MDAEVVKRVQEVNELVEKLDPAIRAAAFELFRDYILEGAEPPSVAQQNTGGSTDGPKKAVATAGDPATFFDEHEGEKPADNIVVLAGYLYGEYGMEPFDVQEIKDLASKVGAAISDRPDKTLGASKREGKALFKRAGKGKFRPTVHAEQIFKTELSLKKGAKKRPAADAT